LRENKTFLRESGGDECSRAGKVILCEMGNSIRMFLSSYQYKAEAHEWLYLVLLHRRPMENHGVNALDEHVVGRRHVTKFREPMFFLQLEF
jgi:hypothetical protein